ncbi:HU family DNA-binding protein [Fusobacterium sp.]|uniref:HU family DNA-binding protein n=1 Tax=Fusobacterium sp. TaxID=68766 RepID=UPI0029047973|nr:HU family DNA-binding protein [Fusobacterium sp.]MDU1912398.1 HU family DNA-binding protein [Fusobacterium sp.]
MNKKELSKEYSKMSNGEISEKKALKEIEIFLETLQQALATDKQVKFLGRGVFEVLERKSRTIANPATREPMTIYPKKTVKFRVSKNLLK